jgi:hypothetical protein
MMVYIASSQPLDLVPWDEGHPAFYVSDLHESEFRVREQFSLPHVYYAGSHEGCGCGFQYGQYPEFDDEERPLKRASLDSFADYLSRQLARCGAIELYACWDGDQTAAPDHQRTLTPSSLKAEEFYFLQKERSRVETDAA